MTTVCGIDGRRPVLLLSMTILCLGSIGSGLASTVLELLFWRVLQIFGASSGLIIGTQVIEDIYKAGERGAATGVLLGVSTRSLHPPALRSDLCLLWTP
jgi:MFS family permease